MGVESKGAEACGGRAPQVLLLVSEGTWRWAAAAPGGGGVSGSLLAARRLWLSEAIPCPDSPRDDQLRHFESERCDAGARLQTWDICCSPLRQVRSLPRRGKEFGLQCARASNE